MKSKMMREREITTQVMIKTEQMWWPRLNHGINPFCFHRSTRILQARIRKWVAILFSKGTSQPRDQNQVSFTVGRFFTTEPPGTPNRPQISQVVLTHFQLKFVFLGLKKLDNRHISFVYLPLSALILNSGPIHACI